MKRTTNQIALVTLLALTGCGRTTNTFVPLGPGTASGTIDAQLVLDEAFAKAAVEDKVVFVHLSAPG